MKIKKLFGFIVLSMLRTKWLINFEDLYIQYIYMIPYVSKRELV